MEVLSQKVTRREFLLKTGLLLLAVTGLSGLWKRVANPFSAKQTSGGYGSRGYGK